MDILLCSVTFVTFSVLPCLGYIAGVILSRFPALVTLHWLPLLGSLHCLPCLGGQALVIFLGIPCLGYFAWVSLPWLPSSGCLALGYLALVPMQWWPCRGYHALMTLRGEGVGPGGVCTCCATVAWGLTFQQDHQAACLVICLVSLFSFLTPASVSLHFPLYSSY